MTIIREKGEKAIKSKTSFPVATKKCGKGSKAKRAVFLSRNLFNCKTMNIFEKS